MASARTCHLFTLLDVAERELGVASVPLEKQVENVEVLLLVLLEHHPRLLEQVGLDQSAREREVPVVSELQLHELAEPRGVVIAERLRVAKSLGDRV